MQRMRPTTLLLDDLRQFAERLKVHTPPLIRPVRSGKRPARRTTEGWLWRTGAAFALWMKPTVRAIHHRLVLVGHEAAAVELDGYVNELVAAAKRADQDADEAAAVKESRWTFEALAVFVRDLIATLDEAGAEQAAPVTKAGATHSPDFTSVDWFGTRYVFSKGKQAGCVQALWKAWEDGGHNLTKDRIAEDVSPDIVRFRLSHVFRNQKTRTYHPAWGTMIQSQGKGVFGLVAPIGA
jgi:hypothetical protein